MPALAVLATLLIRVVFVLEMRHHPYSIISDQVVDAYYYHHWALEIVRGDFWGSEVFFLRPLYPYLLALVYVLFGPHVLPVQFLQTLMSGLSCLFLYGIARRVFGARAAAIAAFGYALTGILVFHTGALLYVEMTVLLSLLFVWLTLVARSILHWILCGIVFGLLVVCRPEFLVFLPVFFFWLWRSGARVRFALIMAGAALVTVAVVPVRNFLVARDPVLFTAHSSINLYFGNNPAANGTWQPAPEVEAGIGFSHERLKREAGAIAGKEVSWSESSRHWLGKTLGFVISSPGRFLRLLGRKFLLFFSNYEVPNNYYPETARPASFALRLAFVNFGLAAAFGILGMVWAWSHWRRALPLYFVVLVFFLSSLVFYVLSRLRAPVIPFLLIFAGFALAELRVALRLKKAARVLIGLAAVAVLYVSSGLIPVGRGEYTAQAQTQLGNILLQQKRPGPALAAFQRALEANPENPSARYSLVLLYAGMGSTAKAQSELERLIRLSEADPGIRNLATLGAARVAIGRRDLPTAARLYRTALEEDPTNAESLYLLGLVYVSMDSLEPARHFLGRALALNPDHGDARSALRAVEFRSSRRNAATPPAVIPKERSD